jgi:hypothetical protein
MTTLLDPRAIADRFVGVKRLFLFALALTALGLAACGGDDESADDSSSTATVKVSDYKACLEDEDLTVSVPPIDFGDQLGLADEPTDTLAVAPDSGGDTGAVPFIVFLFEDADGADAAVEEADGGDGSGPGVDSEGNVAWIFTASANDASQNAEDALRDCVTKAS